MNGKTIMLTAKQVQQYHDTGYLAVPDVLSSDEVAELQRVTDEFVEASRSVAAHTDVYDLEPSHSPAEPRVRRIKNPNLHHETYQARCAIRPSWRSWISSSGRACATARPS